MTHQVVEANQPRLVFSKTASVSFIDKVARTTMKEFSVDKKQQLLLTPRDVRGSRSFHHLDFSKQQGKKLGAQPEKGMLDGELRYNNFERHSMKRKTQSVHSFDSYTKRKNLYHHEDYHSRQTSNIDKIDLKGIKKRWSVNTLVPFDKLMNRVTVRSDRDCVPWLTKLSYNNSKL